MKSDTRLRLLEAAADLFAERGLRGASVRDVCNLAGANPGAVSYHFDGKRQLYRAVLRQAAERLAGAAPAGDPDGPAGAPDPLRALRRVAARLSADRRSTRLLLRDLADGGAVAVEVLEPAVRSAFEGFNRSLGLPDTPGGTRHSRAAFVAMVAPLLLVAGAWPLLARSLQLDDSEADELLLAAAARGLGTRDDA